MKHTADDFAFDDYLLSRCFASYFATFCATPVSVGPVLDDIKACSEYCKLFEVPKLLYKEV